jgi:hypothetical protein
LIGVQGDALFAGHPGQAESAAQVVADVALVAPQLGQRGPLADEEILEAFLLVVALFRDGTGGKGMARSMKRAGALSNDSLSCATIDDSPFPPFRRRFAG